MKKKELEQLAALKNEIRHLEMELQSLPITRDSVKGSMVQYPYIEMTMPIKGVDLKLDTRLRARLLLKKKNLQEQLLKMETWLDDVEDSDIRTILRLRYRNQMSWQQIAFAIGEHDEQQPRKKCKKFLENIKFDEKYEK